MKIKVKILCMFSFNHNGTRPLVSHMSMSFIYHMYNANI